MRVELRPEAPDDDNFLRSLIAEAVTLELGAQHWPESLRAPIVEMQVGNRRMGPQAGFPSGRSCVILADGECAGWIFYAGLESEIHIVEVIVQASKQGRGIGAAALGHVLETAVREGRKVTLTVNALNTGAVRLYERLGFRRVDGNPVQHRMEWP